MFQTVDEYGIIAVGGEIEVQFFSSERPTRKNPKKKHSFCHTKNFILLKELLV
jgi:hypothetical protein